MRAALVCALAAGLALAGLGRPCARAEGLETGLRLMGSRGLNVVPDARMDAPGTLRAGVGVSDPYVHFAVGAQIAEPLSVTIRQSALVSSLTDSPRALSPALDVRLRLVPESAHLPAVAIGADALFGARALASEYIVASKRYGDVDISAGLGWGRMGRGGAFGNPFGFLDRDRKPDEDGVNGPGDWLTGRKIAPFAGVAWMPSFAPGLALKGDWSGADLWAAERDADPGFRAPPRWTAGLSWRVAPGLELGLGTAGARSLMASLNLSGMPERWPVRGWKASSVQKTTSGLYGVSGSAGGQTLSARLTLDPGRPAALQVGRAMRAMAAATGAKTGLLSLSLERDGTRGPVVTLTGAKVRQLEGGRASPEEIWRAARFAPPDLSARKDLPGLTGRFRWILQTDLGLSERTSAVIHRTALLAGGDVRVPVASGITLGGRVRANLFGNADEIPARATGAGTSPGRAEFGAFSGLRVMPEALYATVAATLAPGVHASATGGYLEEMYAGTGGEILWRPFEGRVALGADGWLALPRDPGTAGALGLGDAPVLTGHLNAWYEWPENDLTFYVRAGRYLAGDVGGTLGAMREWRNGVRLDASLTVTDGVDRDAQERREPMGLARMALRVPFGAIQSPYIPEGSEARLTVGSMGRAAGQALDTPAPLYNITRGFSSGELARDWSRLSE